MPVSECEYGMVACAFANFVHSPCITACSVPVMKSNPQIRSLTTVAASSHESGASLTRAFNARPAAR